MGGAPDMPNLFKYFNKKCIYNLFILNILHSWFSTDNNLYYFSLKFLKKASRRKIENPEKKLIYRTVYQRITPQLELLFPIEIKQRPPVALVVAKN